MSYDTVEIRASVIHRSTNRVKYNVLYKEYYVEREVKYPGLEINYTITFEIINYRPLIYVNFLDNQFNPSIPILIDNNFDSNGNVNVPDRRYLTYKYSTKDMTDLQSYQFKYFFLSFEKAIVKYQTEQKDQGYFRDKKDHEAFRDAIAVRETQIERDAERVRQIERKAKERAERVRAARERQIEREAKRERAEREAKERAERVRAVRER